MQRRAHCVMQRRIHCCAGHAVHDMLLGAMVTMLATCIIYPESEAQAS